MVAALVVWLGATAYTAPLCRHPALILERRPAVMLAKKVKKGKEAFVPYEISGDSVPMFPLPARRDAMQAHKKFGDKGVSPSKVPQGALDAHHPTIDLSYPGLRVLHLDPPVLAIDGFFTDEECDAYRALAECTSGDAHRLEQSATFGGTSTARTSTTWFLRLQAVPNLLARVSALLGAPLENFEEPQLVRYQAGRPPSLSPSPAAPTLAATEPAHPRHPSATCAYLPLNLASRSSPVATSRGSASSPIISSGGADVLVALRRLAARPVQQEWRAAQLVENAAHAICGPRPIGLPGASDGSIRSDSTRCARPQQLRMCRGLRSSPQAAWTRAPAVSTGTPRQRAATTLVYLNDVPQLVARSCPLPCVTTTPHAPASCSQRPGRFFVPGRSS